MALPTPHTCLRYVYIATFKIFRTILFWNCTVCTDQNRICILFIYGDQPVDDWSYDSAHRVLESSLSVSCKLITVRIESWILRVTNLDCLMLLWKLVLRSVRKYQRLKFSEKIHHGQRDLWNCALDGLCILQCLAIKWSKIVYTATRPENMWASALRRYSSWAVQHGLGLTVIHLYNKKSKKQRQ